MVGMVRMNETTALSGCALIPACISPRSFWRSGVALIISFTAITANGQLLNGSFESEYGLYTNSSNPSSISTAAVGWVQYANGIRISTNETGDANSARTGSFSLQCSGSSFGQSEGAYEIITNGVSPGQNWVFSGYARIPSSNPLTNSSVIGMQPFGRMRLSFLDTDGDQINYFDAPDIYSADGLDAWLSITVTGIAPAEAAQIRVDVMEIGFFGNPSGSIFFDDLSLTVDPSLIPEPSPFVLVNYTLVAGFGMWLRRKNRRTRLGGAGRDLCR